MELIKGQCEWCGDNFERYAVLGGEVFCLKCKKPTENWDTVNGSTMSPSLIPIINE